GDLERRQRELLIAHRAEWSLPWSDWVSEWEFRRGFVETITAEAPAFLAQTASLLEREPVGHVRFHEAEDYIRDLAALPFLRTLRVLDLSQCAVGAADAVAIAESPYLDRLETLDLSGSHIGTEGARALAASSRLSNLTSLLLGGNEIGATGVEALAAS